MNHCAIFTLNYKEASQFTQKWNLSSFTQPHVVIYSVEHKKIIFFYTKTVCQAPNRIKKYHKSSFWSLTGMFSMKCHCTENGRKSLGFGMTAGWVNDGRMFIFWWTITFTGFKALHILKSFILSFKNLLNSKSWIRLAKAEVLCYGSPCLPHKRKNYGLINRNYDIKSTLWDMKSYLCIRNIYFLHSFDCCNKDILA